jgi:hypothetical protein
VPNFLWRKDGEKGARIQEGQTARPSRKATNPFQASEVEMPLPPSYTIVDLVAPPGEDSDGVRPFVKGLDDASQVVADNYPTGIGLQRLAYIYRGGIWDNIQALSGSQRTIAHDIKGYATGSSEVGGSPHAFRSDGLSQDLGRLPGDDFSVGTAISADGLIVGFSGPLGGMVYHPFLWSSTGGMQPLPVALGQKPQPTAISLPEVTDLFSVIGYNESGRVFHFDFATQVTRDIGTRGASTVTGGMNGGRGQTDLVGYSDSGPFWVPNAILESSTIMDLPVPEPYSRGTAVNINAARQVVGWAMFGTESRAFAYAADELIPTGVDLNTRVPGGSGFILLETAAGINNHGQIAGVGKVSANRRHVFLLNPSEHVLIRSLEETLRRARELGTFGAAMAAELASTARALRPGTHPYVTLAFVLFEAAMAFIHMWTLKDSQPSGFDARFPTQVTPPQFGPFPTIPDDPVFPSGFAAAANQANAQSAQATSFMSAVRTTLNRMEGAFLMGDEARFNMQHQALNSFVTSAGGALDNCQAQLRAAATSLAGSPIDVTVTAEEIVQFQKALNAQGFDALPQQERDLFPAFGLTQVDFSLVINDLLSANPNDGAGLCSDAIIKMANWIRDVAGLYTPV